MNQSSIASHSNWVALAALLLGARAISGDDVHTVTIFQGRQIAVAVPAGWKLDEELDPHHGTPTLHVQDPKGEVALVLAFFPDPANTQPNRADLEAEAQNLFEPYLESPSRTK